MNTAFHAERSPRGFRLTGWSRLWLVLLGVLAVLGLPGMRAADPLVTLEYRITGIELRASPVALSVPKGVAGSVLVQVIAGSETNTAATQAAVAGAHVEGWLRGPGLPEARRVVGPPNAPLLLPPLSLVGDYQLDSVRLVDSSSGAVRLEAVPSAIPVRVFDEVLVSKVTSRPLTTDEIQEKGIVIDERNFRAVEFEVGFVLDGKTVPVRFPVVAPRFGGNGEIIPAAELEKRLADAAALNQEISATAQLPPELEASRLNIQVQGVNFQRVEGGDAEGTALTIPPIPAIVVIPGNIGFLNQFFSVQIFTENAAPSGSGLSAFNIQARMQLPPGADRLVSTNYDQPGDDPLRFARIGAGAVVQPVQPVVRPGADGKPGTADDIGRLFPGETGQGEFLVEGLQEGLHVMDIELTADLDGLAAGTVKIRGKAAGSVLVRNPRFSLAFTHPRTIRAGEPYEASVTILNTGITPANLVSVTLPSASLSGGVLESADTVQLGTILPGQTATATYRVRAQRTGAISFSNLTTGDDSVQGRFRLRMGVDERGVALSPDSLALPDYVTNLPPAVIAAANRVLGQAVGVATAAQLPAGVMPVGRSILTTRSLELAEAGQRLAYGDPLARVLADLLLDWQGGRGFNAGFDQILRETNAGREWREAIAGAIESADTSDAVARSGVQAADIAGRGESVLVAAATSGRIELRQTGPDRVAALERSDVARAVVYGGTRGTWAVAGGERPAAVVWRFPEAPPRVDVAVLETGADGLGRWLRWTVTDPLPDACYRHLPGTLELAADIDCDGGADSVLVASVTAVREAAPAVLAVLQDLTVLAGRPSANCLPAPGNNYGTVLAVLFSKPMTQERANIPGAYTLENGNVAGSVQIQPGGRVALLNMRGTVGGIRPRVLTVTGVSDARGNAVQAAPVPVAGGSTRGIAIRGRVVRADGSPAVAVPVTLTEHDLKLDTGFSSSCESWVQRPMQVFTDANGFFEIDYVMAGIPFSVSATDTSGLGPEAVQALLASAEGDAFARDRLRERLESAAAAGQLAGAFGAGTVAEAIARAEGVDRAVLRDSVEVGSPREGSEMFIALRFRGRGTVAGTVLGPDGETPVAGVAVNLFPDPDSREQGRGVFSDSTGRFHFEGVPLGVYTVSAVSASGSYRTVAGVLEDVGEIDDVPVVLGAQVVPRATLAGQVFETDNATPHANGRVYVGRYEGGVLKNVVAVAECDGSGFWVATNVPASTYDVVAVSADGKRRGERLDVPVVGGESRFLSIALQGRATVVGRVETANGIPVANALVAGGEAVVRTDAGGRFVLQGVPTGQRTVSAGVERTTDPQQPRSDPAFDFPRLGSATVNVVAGVENVAVIRLQAMGRITGRVLDVLGRTVPNVRVAIPQERGFLWVDSDANGNYRFEGLGLGAYTMSAPAPGTAATDTSGLLAKIRNGSEEEIQAAIGEAFRIFTGLADPYLNPTNFNPATWGYASTQLAFDGQTAVADIRFLREGTVAGMVLNAQGVPIGARVRLTGVGPLPNGAPSTVVRGEMNSDPALGTFEFRGALLAGPWMLQAASPFYPVILSESGVTTQLEPNATGIVLRFPPVPEVNGRLMGRVVMPDGTPAGKDVNVRISFGEDYVLRTDTNGLYDTQIAIPAGNYTVQAEDPATGLKGVAGVGVRAGVTNVADVRLLGKGAIRVLVEFADGRPVTNAAVEIQQGGYPGDRFTGNTDASGGLEIANVFEGSYAVLASAVVGPVRISGRSGTVVAMGSTGEARVRLAPTATLRGTFVKRDGSSPVPFAQVSVGSLGFASTDAAGFFEVVGIPLGTYRLVGQDPVTGSAASLSVTLTTQGEVRTVQLIEQSRGEVRGRVIGSYGSNTVPAASVTLAVGDGLTAPRSVTSGADGSFSFPGVPVGPFTVTAKDPVSGLGGAVSASLGAGAAVSEVNVQIQPLGVAAVRVLRPDGVTPAVGASVRLSGPRNVTLDADAEGWVEFRDLPLGGYSVRADSRVLSENRSAAVAQLNVSAAGSRSSIQLSLGGVGRVTGRVFRSDGVTPAGSVQLALALQSPLFPGVALETIADADGRFAFANIPVGGVSASATSLALAANASGRIARDGDEAVLDLVLGESGGVTGRLVRADGNTPVGGVDVLISFRSQSSFAGLMTVRSGADGTFRFANVPVGSFVVESVGADFGGLARASSGIASNGEVKALGDVVFDEADPRVVAVQPADSAVDVSTLASVEIEFSEPLDPASVNAGGIYLRSSAGTVAATVALAAPTGEGQRRVRLKPASPLRSQASYEVVVLDGDRRDVGGNVVASGPRDRVGRPLTVPFLSRFTTADNDPPRLVSAFPTNGSAQVDPRTVVRLSFSEPIRPAGAVVELRDSAGPVAGSASVGVNGLVLNFTPAAELAANRTFTLTVSNVFDLAGNPAPGQPFVIRFETLDTVGPAFSALRIVDGRPPIAGSTVEVEALPAAEESGVSVRFTQDLASLAVDAATPFRVPVVLPPTGATTVRAIASDRYGNEGPIGELRIETVPNQAPQVSLIRLDAAGAAVGGGQTFRIRASATDDLGVTNLVITVGGLAAFTTNFPGAGPGEVAVTVPADAIAGAEYRVTARAVDRLGVESPEASLVLVVDDVFPPEVVILEPAPGAFTRGYVEVASRDNSRPFTLDLRLSGALTQTQSVVVSVPAGSWSTNRFLLDLTGAPPGGGNVVATISASDARTNVATVNRAFRLPDVQAPRLTEIQPTNGAQRRSLWMRVAQFRFDEPLDPGSVPTNAIVVTNSAGVATAFVPELAEGGARLDLRYAVPLLPGTTYTNLIPVQLADAAGNRWRRADGSAPPVGGETMGFTTAAFLGTAPAPGFRVMSGQPLPVSVRYEPGIGAARFVFRAGEGTPVSVAAGAESAETTLVAPAVAVAGPVSLVLVAYPGGGDEEGYALAPIPIEVVPVGGDTDGDGMPDPFEIAQGFDPFGNDAGLDPDGDGLTNLQEYGRTTDPRRGDTDGDTLTDGAEVAAGTNPLLRDTDGDGLDDNLDPRPTQVDGGVTVEGIAAVEIEEGGTTNLVFRALSTTSPVVRLEVQEAAAGPAWISVRSLELTNSPTSGTGTLTVQLNPLHDAAGEHVVRIRATSAAGIVGTLDVAVRVVDGPDLVETRWLAAINGDWNDPARWSAGVPGPGKVAIVDQPGAYTVRIAATTVSAAGVILAAPDALISLADVSLEAPVEQRSGSAQIEFHRGVAVGRAWAMRGRLQMFSRDVNTFLDGAGHIDLQGLLEVSPAGGGGGHAYIRTLVNAGPGSTVRIHGNAQAGLWAGGWLSTSGTLEVNGGGRFAVVNNGPAHELRLLSGARMPGAGVVAVDGPNRFVVEGVARGSVFMALSPPARATGSGRLVFEGNQSLSSEWDLDLVIPDGVTVGSEDAHLRRLTTVEAGGTLGPNHHRSLTIGGVLSNRGTLRLYSRDVNTTVGGTGSVVNHGSVRVFPAGGGGGFGRLHLALTNAAEGRVEVDAGAQLHLGAGGRLVSPGNLRVDGLAQIEGSEPPLEIVLEGRAAVSGAGTMRLHGPSRLVVNGDCTVEANLELRDSSRATGAGVLRLASDQNLTGQYFCPVVLLPGSVVGFAGCTLHGAMLIEEGADAFVHHHQSLAIQSGVTNRSTFRMFSRDVNTTLSGAGFLVNEGLFRVFQAGGGGGFARLHAAFTNRPGSRFVVDSGAQMHVGEGGRLESAAAMQVDGHLQTAGNNPSVEIVLGDAVELGGAGVVRLHGSTRLWVQGRATVSANLELRDSSRVDGPGILLLGGDQYLTGSYFSPVVLSPGSVVGFAGCTLSAPLTIEAGADAFVHHHQSVRLDAASTNRSTLRLFSRDVNTTILGTGVLHNEGTLRFVQAGGGGGFARLELPVVLAPGGLFQVDAGSQGWISGPGSLALRSTLNVDGFLGVQVPGDSAQVRMEAGGLITGGGAIRLHGSSQLVMAAPGVVSANLELYDTARVSGAGQLTLREDQTLTGRYDAPVLLAGDGVAWCWDPLFAGPLMIAPEKVVQVSHHRSMRVALTLTNRGTLRLFSRDVNTTLAGEGRVVNEGLLEVLQAGGGGGWGRIELRVENAAQGRLAVRSGAQAFVDGAGSLDASGPADIDGLMLVAGPATAAENQLRAGAVVSGQGALRFTGERRLRLLGDATVSANLELLDSATAEGPGQLRLEGDQTLMGRYNGPVWIASNAVAGVSGARMTSTVITEAGALVFVNANQNLFVDGSWTNRGEFRMPCRDVNTWLRGTGTWVEEGLFRVVQAGGGGGWAFVHLPIHVSGGGVFQVDGACQAGFGSGGSLTVAGELSVTGWLRLWNEGPARDLTLAEGGRRSGGGTVDLLGANRLVVTGNAALTGGLTQLLEASSMAGTGTLTVGTGATLRWDHPVVFPGSMHVAGTLTTVSGTSRIAGTLRLLAGGVLNNPAILEAGAYDNLGGTVNGALPVVIGLGGGGFVIQSISIVDPVLGLRSAGPAVDRGPSIQLDARGPSRGTFVVEVSDDLRTWYRVPAQAEEVSPGRYRVGIGETVGERVFFRLVR